MTGLDQVTAASGLAGGNQFAERLDRSPDEEPYIVPRFHEYARDYTAPGGQTYRLLHNTVGNNVVSAHHQLSTGKYRAAGYLSWFGGKVEHSGSTIDGGVIHKVHVSGPHQRRGLASAMLDFARERNPEMDVRHSTALTDAGRAWSEKTGSTYTVRLEHGRRREPGSYHVPEDGPVTPAYLQHPVGESYVHVHVPHQDEHGNDRDMDAMDAEAHQLAAQMSTHPSDMVTKSEILSMEAAQQSSDYRHGYGHGLIGAPGNKPIFERQLSKGKALYPEDQEYLRGHDEGTQEAARREQDRAAKGQHRCPECRGSGAGGWGDSCRECQGSGAISEEQAHKSDTLYHLTDNPHFTPSTKHVPEDNATSIHERSSPGLFAAHDVTQWTHGHGYVRPYVAELHVPHINHEPGRWGGERFIPAEHLNQVKVNRIMPLAAHLSEQFEGKHYDGLDAREMSPEQHAVHKQLALDTLRTEHGHSDEDIEHLRERWAMGQAGPDYDNLTFHQMTGETYGLHPDNHHHQMLFARHPDHGYVGHVRFTEEPDHVKVHNLDVWPEHQRRGVASQLMGELERRNPGTMIDHGVRSPHGTQWAKSYYGPEHEGVDFDNGWTITQPTRDRQLVGARHTAVAKRCPCGMAVQWDPIDGWQHADGSISHDGQFFGKSVSDLVGTTPPHQGARHTAAEDVDLYRGVHFGSGSPQEIEHHHAHPEEVAGRVQRALGRHWTTDSGVAYNFALGRDIEGNAAHQDWGEDEEGDQHAHGVVVHAKVPAHHVLDEHSPEWQNYADAHAIFSHDSAEYERTVPDGTPVRIHRAAYVSSSPMGEERETQIPAHHFALHTTAAGQLPPGYDMDVREQETTRWGLPALHVRVRHDGKPVAGLSVHQRQDETTGGALVGHPNIDVDPEHQRKGLGTAMYGEIHRRWPDVPVVHSEHASDAARALNQSLKGTFGPDLHHGKRDPLWYWRQHEAADWHEYRRIQDSQQRRYERPGIGGDQEDKDRYFGTGEMMGHGQERQLTPKDWITHSRGQQLHDVEPEFQEHWRGYEMGHGHGLKGRVDTEELDREYGASSHPEHFAEGYADGLEHAMGEHERIAVLQSGKGTAPAFVSLMKVAHVSGNTVDALHCPFCGSGSVTARSDGSIECGFCTAAYTVQVQPQFSAFPQSVDGAQYPWPGRDDMGMGPGGTPVPPGGGGAAIPGGDEGEQDGDAPPWAQDGNEGDEEAGPPGADDDEDDDEDTEAEVGGSKAPPFGKKSYRNSRGTVLSYDDFLRHLAILSSSDPARTAAFIKAERQGASV